MDLMVLMQSRVDHPPHPEQQPQQRAHTAAAQQLAVTCARALGTCRCANLACSNLRGAEIRGRRCSGCSVVRFCDEACSRADWRRHRVACRQLRPAQQ